MIKKIFYFSLTLTLYFLLNSFSISAKEYCYLYLNQELIDSVELPFYYYELDRFTTIEGSRLPIINYTRKATYIDSLTKCELIEKEITYDEIYMNSASIADYSQEEILLNNETHFYASKLKSNNTILKGLSSSKDEEPPIISGYQDKYITNIDFPLDLNLLIKTFSAYDNFDGNISNNIKIEYEEYSQNINKVGTYAIILSVEDSSLNKTSITFYIEVIDTTPPIIKGENFFISYLSSPLDIYEIKNSLTASDNTNIDLTSQIYVYEDTYSAHKNVVGEHIVFFCVYDNSNNQSLPFKVTIEVKDDIIPIIEGLDYFDSYLSSPLSIKEIMYSLAASDNGKDISQSIFITKDLYTNYQNTIGEKKIYFQAMDEDNNLSNPFEVTINLIDDIKPTIYGLNIFDSYLSSPLSLTYIKQKLTALDNIDGNITNSLEIITDSYSTNINNKGTFYITFVVKDYSSNISEEFKITINSIDDIPPHFIGPELLTYQIDQKPDLEIVLSNYIAKDNVDQNISVEILEDTFSSSLGIGTFYLSLSCTDSSNNTSNPFIIKIELVEELTKVNNATLLLPTSKLLTYQEINNLINFSSSYIVLEDTYTSNYNIEGSYYIHYKLENNTILNISITTYTDKNENNIETAKKTIKKETFISKIKRFFKNIISKLKKFFKNLIL